MLGPDVERRLREAIPRVVAAVTRRCGDFAAAEDAVQDALLAAATDWPRSGVPDNLGGWLFQVAVRRAADQRDAERARRRREAEVAAGWGEAAPPAGVDLDAELPDDTLALLFTCCHPALTDASAIALTLRAVGGLTTAEIARAFLVPEATMAQRISRAKQTIQAAGGAFALPGVAERERRVGAVLHVLYLIFQEGHAASGGEALLRVDLATEAIRLARLLRATLPQHAETEGLLALLLLTDARRAARTDVAGDLVPLDEQDRNRWDRAAIAEGRALVEAAFARGAVGTFQLQAAIATLHAEASSVEATDWPQILALYTVLLRLTASPVVALNRAVAVAMVHGPRAGLDLVADLDRDPSLESGHRLEAVRAHLLERLGDLPSAIASFRASAARAPNAVEQRYLLRKAARLAGEGEDEAG